MAFKIIWAHRTRIAAYDTVAYDWYSTGNDAVSRGASYNSYNPYNPKEYSKRFSCRSDTLHNANAGGIVTFECYNLKNTQQK